MTEDGTAPVTALAFDVGGTSLRGARVGHDGTLQLRLEAPTPRSSVEDLRQALVDMAGRLIDPAQRPRAAALAIAGTVDRARGEVRTWPTTGFHDFALCAPLEDALGIPFALVNDVNAAALGEAAALGCDDLVAVFVGTGVGTGFVSGGALIQGRRGMAGEGGHVIFRPGGEPCPAGCQGCCEAYLGGDALGRRALARGLPAEPAALFAAWRAGDPGASALMEDALEALAALISDLVTLLDPERIALGGGLASRSPEMLHAAREAVRRLPLGNGRRDIVVEPSLLGQDAGLLGAARLALAMA